MKTIIVAGCTRSGLTLTMQILNKGGYPCFGEWPAFENYEIGGINFDENRGKAIKLVDTHLQFPPEGEYVVLRLQRDLTEQSKSIVKFMEYVGFTNNSINIENVKKSLMKDYQIIDQWVKKQSRYIFLNFEDIINSPEKTVDLISNFIDFKLDIASKNCVVIRNSNCYDGMLEEKFI